WNLHKALSNHHLDFFWLASSILTAVGQVGQGSSFAAGTFLEAFCQYRHSLGFPASVLNICPVEGLGFLSLVSSVDMDLSDSGSPSIAPSLPWGRKSQVIMGLHSDLDLNDPNNKASWRHNRRIDRYHNVHAGDKAGSGERVTESGVLKAFLGRISEDAAEGEVSLLSLEIGRKIHEFMLEEDEEVDISPTLGQIGLYFLMANELRRWFKQVWGWTTLKCFGNHGVGVNISPMRGAHTCT
ncbi:hypothetical protein M434DRAFT_66287, partial [Hypoxylon sp. CO27-5]